METLIINHHFGPFNPKQNVADLKLDTVVQDLQNKVSVLWRLLCGTVEQRAGHDVRTVDSSSSEGHQRS